MPRSAQSWPPTGYSCRPGVPGGNFTNGNKIQIWDCNGHTNQASRRRSCAVTPTETGCLQQAFFGGGKFQWKSKMNGNKCLDLYSSDTTNGKLLEVWDCADYGD